MHKSKRFSLCVYRVKGMDFSLWYHSEQFSKHLVPLLLKAMLQWLKNKKDFFFQFTSWAFSRKINLVLNPVNRMWIELTISNKFAWLNRLWWHVRNLYWSLKGTWCMRKTGTLFTFTQAVFYCKDNVYQRLWVYIQGDQHESFNLCFQAFMSYDLIELKASRGRHWCKPLVCLGHSNVLRSPIPL